MQVTLHGGPHDGRRITIDPAAAASGSFLVPDLLAAPIDWSLDETEPTATPIPVSIYRRQTWAEGPTTGPDAAFTTVYPRWQYTGHYQ